MSSLTQVEIMLESIGKSYAELLEQGLIPKAKLRKIFPEDDESYLQTEQGLCYCFDAMTKTLKAIIVSVMKRTVSEEIFRGTLSEPYPCRDRQTVLATWGEPERSKGPLMMPLPMGKVGGWDLYSLAAKGFHDVELVYQYTADLDVSGIVFSAKDVSSQEAP